MQRSDERVHAMKSRMAECGRPIRAMLLSTAPSLKDGAVKRQDRRGGHEAERGSPGPERLRVLRVAAGDLELGDLLRVDAGERPGVPGLPGPRPLSTRPAAQGC